MHAEWEPYIKEYLNLFLFNIYLSDNTFFSTGFSSASDLLNKCSNNIFFFIANVGEVSPKTHDLKHDLKTKTNNHT